MTITKLKTDPKVLEALQKAASRKPTPEEVLEQRASFVYGSMDSNSPVTRQHIKQVIREQEGLPE